MAVLYMRIAGAMQSWGTQSRFTHRDTGLEPSKSGVIGLLCAALGKPRDEKERIDLPSLKELARLKMGIRVDQQGEVERDYHTAQNVAKAGGGIKECEPSDRFYLADAVFLVVLQGDDNKLKQLHEALKSPVWQLYLGRKSFLPDPPVYLKDGFQSEIDDLEEALKAYPFLCRHRPNQQDKLRTEIEVNFGQGEQVKHDQPLSFSERLFGLRHVKTGWVDTAKLPQPKEELCIFPS
ncbi:MAG: type I-E CRISPR-associated protein Cas5/CasD [Chloroflexi bacterium]|nr:type I-E CRISPR-associated protein Cas5/CasD [Chloroflexota bacterium]